MTTTDAAISVRLELLDHALRGVTSYELDSAYMTSTDGWSVEAWLDESEAKQIGRLELQPVELTIGGAQQVLGRVEVTQVGGNGSIVTLQGRDYLSDMVECNVDPTLKIKEQMTVAEAVRLAASPVGITTVASGAAAVGMRNTRTGKPGSGGSAGKDFAALKLDELKPQPGQGIFDFCNRIAARHGATIQPASKRDTVLLDAPDYTQTPRYRIRRGRDDAARFNNVISATARRDFSTFPTVALFSGQQARGAASGAAMATRYDFLTLARAFSTELGAIAERVYQGSGEAARRKPGDTTALGAGKLYRLLYLKDDQSRNPEQLERAAKRAIAERLKDTLAYSVTLRGHVDPESGGLWAVNTVVDVHDEIADVTEPLWIERRSFRYSADSGATTELECWRPESFQIG